MKPNLPLAKEGAITFLKAGHLDNEYLVVEFNNKPAVTQEWTHDIVRLMNHPGFLPSTREKGLLDAMFVALDKLRTASNPRKVILALTSGGETVAAHKASEIRNLARQLDVQIFAVDLPEESDFSGDITENVTTADVVEPLGGQTLVGSDAEEYVAICRRVAVAVRNQYAIAYRPPNPQHDGKFHHIQVKLRPPKGTPDLFVQTREGYYAAEP
jgi:Ca-activated chloride channel family protein